jgi:pyruvate formate lyase activating enzyme
MEIGGYLPFSLNDYPGHPAAVVFTQGCNYRCPYCHNAELLDRAKGICDSEDVVDRLRRRRGLLSGVVISGGEPTVQDDLPTFCAGLHELGFRVKLDTNGSHPAMLSRLLNEGLVDYVAMDIKAPLKDYCIVAGVTADTADIRTSIELLIAGNIPHRFRTTVVPGLLKREDLEAIKNLLPLGSMLVEQVYNPRKTLIPRNASRL